MKARIEKAMSKILSRKYDANITIRFKEKKDGSNKSRTIKEK